MKKKYLVLFLLLLLLLLLFFFLFSGGSGEEKPEENEIENGTEEKECEDYTFSTCPDGCIKKCVSGTGVTTDCEGPGSCISATGGGATPEEPPYQGPGMESSKSNDCTATGGALSTALCCPGTPDYPNLCGENPCQCGLEGGSSEIPICMCGPGRCFNGEVCVDSP